METTPLPAGSSAFIPNELFRRILVPLDFFEGSRRALATALELRRQYGAEVHLFRLTESSENDRFLAGVGAEGVAPNGMVGDAQARILRFVENVFPGQSREVQVHATVGNELPKDIADAADKVGATLVIIAAEAKQTVLRSNVEKIIKGLGASVLLLRVPHEMSPSDVPT
jgi:nucleotide-binding universal stress UspA family protein